MSKLKLPIIIVLVVAALGGGLFASGMVGGDSGPTKKHAVEPIPMLDDFIVNLSDSDASALLSMNIAIKLAPMDEAHWAAFSGAGGGGHGGAGEAPGPAKVAAYSPFRDAIIRVASSFDSATLKTEKGKQQLKDALLDEFHQIEQVDIAEAKADANAEDPAHVGPPYHVLDLDFTKFVVQVQG